MDTIGTLRELVEKLPRSTRNLSSNQNQEGFSVDVHPEDSYVWPNVTNLSGIVKQPVILITAPGAGGKSAASKAIASHLNAPLVDLAHLQVGSNTITGLFPKMLGWRDGTDFVKNLLDGSRSVILDGLDEARLLAGRNNFDAFLEDLAEFVKEAVPSGQIVILGRREAIEDAYLFLDNAGIVASITKLHPLSHRQAIELVDKSLDRKTIDGRPYTVHRDHPVPFGELREDVFYEVAASLEAPETNPTEYWSKVDYFLGYPPVILAIADRLAVENPRNEQSRISKTGRGARAVSRGKLLKGIVEDILDREIEKVRSKMAKVLDLRGEQESILYTREEQVLRVLRIVLSENFDIHRPASLSESQLPIYDEHIESFVNEHPFLLGRRISNPVFADYVRAFVITSDTIAAEGVTKSQLVAMLTPPGAFYAHFMHALSATRATELEGVYTAAIPDESYVSDIIASHAQAVSGGSFVTYYGDEKEAFITLSEIPVEDSVDPGYSLSFEIDSPSGVLELKTPLSNCMIACRGDISLSSPSDTVQLGPSTYLICRQLHIEGERFVASGEGSGVLIASSESASHSPQLKVASYPPEVLSISWPDPWFQWNNYIVSLTPSVSHIDSYLSNQILFWIRRILNSMKSSSRDMPSIYGELLDNLIIGVNPVGRATLAGLISLGIVKNERVRYRLQLDALKPYGVNYASLAGPDFPDILAKLHKDVTKTDAVLAIGSRPA
jgi:hypothetical protein